MLLTLLAFGSCSGPRAQWTVYIASDAPIPEMGDRLFIELFDPTGTRLHQLELAAGEPAGWPISFGVVPLDPTLPLRIRARLYRSSFGFGVDAPDGMLLDGMGLLPPPRGETRVSLPLMMSCFGIPSDTTMWTTCDPATGERRALPALAQLDRVDGLPAPGTWPPARQVPCPDVPDGMVCIPGGAFLLGGKHATPSSLLAQPLPMRLVQLSPFAIDVDELTVKQFRVLWEANAVFVDPYDLVDRDPNENLPSGACTWALGHNGDPLNCVSFDLATRLCEARGLVLPTEAEWEYAAGNLAEKTPYPWGEDGEICSHAVVSNGRISLSVHLTEETYCRLAYPHWGPLPGGNSADVTALGVRNLGGNLAEFVSDRVASYSDPCWQGAPVLLVNPRCDMPAPDQAVLQPSMLFSIRGGDWGNSSFSPLVENRNALAVLTHGETLSPYVGFRCVKRF
jgi:formylglycine-generating enzyme